MPPGNRADSLPAPVTGALAHWATTPAILVLAFVGGALPPFLLAFVAWPEIVAPAWFVAQGWRLYDAVFFPHTPLTILGTAAAGELAGFSAPVFRGLAALSAGLTAGLLVGAGRRTTSRLGALLIGVPLLALQGVYFEGPALWPEPLLAPFPLAATLLVERWERRGRTTDLGLAGLLLGTGILVKQTFAWFGLAALLWLVFGSPRRSFRAAATLAGGVAGPYALFVLLWGIAFGTTGHVKWTLIHVVFGNHASEIEFLPDPGLLSEAVAPFLALAALALLRAALFRRRVPSPLIPLALAAFGMAWPRWGLLHLAAAQGLLVLAALRGVRLIPVLARRFSRSGASRLRVVFAAAGAGLLVVHLVVAAFGAGPLLVDAVGGPTRFWNDERTTRQVAAAREWTRPGGPLLVFEAPHETLYPLTGTVTPGGFYVNPSFWYYLNKDGLDERLATSLRGREDVPILFREPPEGRDGDRLRETRTYRVITTETSVVGRVNDSISWRRPRPAVP